MELRVSRMHRQRRGHCPSLSRLVYKRVLSYNNGSDAKVHEIITKTALIDDSIYERAKMRETCM